MLPHLTGKFNVERFIKTGATIMRRAYPVPDTPAYRQAQEDLARDQAALKARLSHGG